MGRKLSTNDLIATARLKIHAADRRKLSYLVKNAHTVQGEDKNGICSPWLHFFELLNYFNIVKTVSRVTRGGVILLNEAYVFH